MKQVMKLVLIRMGVVDEFRKRQQRASSAVRELRLAQLVLVATQFIDTLCYRLLLNGDRLSG
ncbi:hypothetical protein, partial [Photobacterium damselae]|uniref:hypothetical protein n=1 Tax=Photobacterium damselae TaxID=38293 RepID=UPI0040687EF5